MTNEETIEVLDDMKIKIAIPKSAITQRKRNEALDTAIKALEQQPCEDAVSREAVKEMLTEEWTKYMPMESDVSLSFVLEKISELPSVTPKARWIPVSEKPQKGRYLCTFEHYDGKCIDFGSFDGEVWYIKPIAWMPLPTSYQGGEGEE